MKSWLGGLFGASIVLILLSLVASCPSDGGRLVGFNVVVSPHAPFGGPAAENSLHKAKQTGATAIAIIPFLWQPTPTSAAIVRGSDMDDDELRQAIRVVRKLGLIAIVKPHVWVDGSWAGAVAANSEDGWRAWFVRYAAELARIARIAAEEHADILCIGTELAKTTERPEWATVIENVRATFPGEITYAAHNIDEAVVVPFWNLLDSVSLTLYPPLGADQDRAHRLSVMRATAERIDALATDTGKRVIVSEIGIRSAEGAAAKPWESAEEREAPADPALQATVIADWVRALDRPSIRGVLIWRWFTDPNAGGLSDSDFTVQGKPAEDELRCAWMRRCAR